MRRRTPGGAPARPSEDEVRRARRTSLTSRAAVLAVAICAVVLTLAVPVQQYVAQRGQLSTLAQQTRAQDRRVAALERAKARWQDPAYIRQQARQRLHFVDPGETAYVVIDPNRRANVTARQSDAAVKDAATGPWYSQVWQSVVDAGTPAHSTPAAQPRVASTTKRHTHRNNPAPISPGAG